MIFDHSKSSYKKETVKSKEAAYSNFFLLVNRNTLIFEVNADISKKKFLSMFSKFWEKVTKKSIEFALLKEYQEEKLIDIIKSWDKIKRATFNLKPSNPHAEHVYKKLDKMIKDAGADNVQMTFESKEGSLNLKSIISQGLAMVKNGLGNFNLKGEADKIFQRISSKLKIIKTELTCVDDLDIILDSLFREVKKLISNEKI